MKHILLLSTIALTVLSGCSTAFKSGQTPDDVYYSPGREVASAKEEEISRQQQDEYREYISSQDDRYLRMKVANRSRWSSIDDYDYWYDSRYDFGNYNVYDRYAYTNPWNPTWGISIGGSYGRRGWGGGYGWNNPLYTVVYYGSPKFSGGGSTSGSNISAFRNKNYSNENYGFKDPKTGAFIPNNGNSNFGNLLKRVFSNSASGNGNTTSYDRPARTFNNSTPSNNNSTPAPSSNAGGNSGGVKSSGSSTSTGRGGRG